MATLFRGYEVILKGRDPRDAIFISSRACGVCGGVHSTTARRSRSRWRSASHPPPLGIVARNMLLSVEYLYDHPLHLFLLAGPDYSEPAVARRTPSSGSAPDATAPNGGAARLLDDRRDHDRP